MPHLTSSDKLALDRLRNSGGGGSQGPQGPCGAKGDKGDKGETGADGITGAQGQSGSAGNDGAPGSPGVQGNPGVDGAQGEQGPEGPRGLRGEIGPQGPKGDTGNTGSQGPAGADGAQGQAGNDGTQGPQGNPGTTDYTALSNKPTLGDSAAKNVGTTSGTVATGDHNHSSAYLGLHAKADTAIAADTAATLATGADRTKLDGIAAGAEVNVNADWNAGSGDAQILNKPPVLAFNDAEGDPIAIGVAADGTSAFAARRDHVHARTRADDGIKYTALANDTLAQNYAVNSATKLTVTAARTLTTTVPAAGCTATTIILTSGTSSYTVTFGTGFKPVGTLATGTTSARVFVISWISDGTNMYETGRTAAMVA